MQTKEGETEMTVAEANTALTNAQNSLTTLQGQVPALATTASSTWTDFVNAPLSGKGAAQATHDTAKSAHSAKLEEIRSAQNAVSTAQANLTKAQLFEEAQTVATDAATAKTTWLTNSGLIHTGFVALADEALLCVNAENTMKVKRKRFTEILEALKTTADRSELMTTLTGDVAALLRHFDGAPNTTLDLSSDPLIIAPRFADEVKTFIEAVREEQ
jgi:hypothetical protein